MKKRNARGLSRGGFCGLFVAGVLSSTNVFASVTGVCSTCHTMHNSQNDATLASSDGAAWSNGSVSGGGDSSAQSYLLVTDCVGCHSSTGTETIVSLGGASVPIVYNTTGYPAKPLAGGNFAEVSADHSKGHNVLGISDPDNVLAYAPGASSPDGSYTIGCANSCHRSLAIPLSGATSNKNGCSGCHNRVKHHGVDPAPGSPENEASGWYRFLGNHDSTIGGGNVAGIEDADWEYTNSASDHNIYLGGTGADETPEAMGRFCAGCHGAFHADGQGPNVVGIDNSDGTNGDGTGADAGGSPWIRHPADYAIPDRGEYQQVLGVAYNPMVPVAKPSLTVGDSSIVEQGDMVMCLSCHRAHGSRHADMLRWDYNSMDSHSSAGGDNEEGCFFCHRTKDDSA